MQCYHISSSEGPGLASSDSQLNIRDIFDVCSLDILVQGPDLEGAGKRRLFNFHFPQRDMVIDI